MRTENLGNFPHAPQARYRPCPTKEGRRPGPGRPDFALGALKKATTKVDQADLTLHQAWASPADFARGALKKPTTKPWNLEDSTIPPTERQHNPTKQKYGACGHNLCLVFCHSPAQLRGGRPSDRARGLFLADIPVSNRFVTG